MKRWLLVFPISLLVLGFSVPSGAAAKPHVVMIVADKIKLDDLRESDLKNFNWITGHGGVALMNTRTSGTMNAENAYMTLGAGSRAVGTLESGAAYAAGEPLENGTAAEILRRNTGYRAKPDNLVLPSIAGIAATNATDDHAIIPGLLGRELHNAGLTTCALGNADLPALPGRQIVSLVMDERGIVDCGAIGRELLIEDHAWPYGYRTDYKALLRAYNRYGARSTLVAIDLGDTSRIEAYSLSLAPDRLKRMRHKALLAADAFLGDLRRILPPDTLIVFVSPSPSAMAQEEGNPMTPIAAYGPEMGAGWLTSSTTRRPGIVANIDVISTILDYLGLPIPSGTYGRPIRSISGQGGLRELLAQDARITANNLWQQSLMKFYTVMLDIIFVLCAIFLIWAALPGVRIAQGLLLLAAGFPLVVLLAPLRQETSNFITWLIALTICSSLVFFLLPRRRLLPLAALFAASAAVIVLDQLWGASLAKYALLSYSPITGARYYGMGNEYIGVLIGVAIMTAGAAFSIWHGRRWLMPVTAIGFVCFTIVLGAPMLGTNIGGAMAGIAGFGFALMLLGDKRISCRTILWIGLGTVGAVLLLALIDSLRPAASQTHLGRLIGQIRADGFLPLWQTIERKMAMNLKLIRFSGWSRVAVFALLALAATFLFPSVRAKDAAVRYPYMIKAIQACLAGALAALIFNDSGVVAAAIMLIFPVTAWLYMLLEMMAGKSSES